MTIFDRRSPYDDPISSLAIWPSHITSYVYNLTWQNCDEYTSSLIKISPVRFGGLHGPGPRSHPILVFFLTILTSQAQQFCQFISRLQPFIIQLFFIFYHFVILFWIVHTYGPILVQHCFGRDLLIGQIAFFWFSAYQ
jgi:hypothetical protein